MRAIRLSLATAMILGLLLPVAMLKGFVSAQPYPPPVGSLSAGASPTAPTVGGTSTVTAAVLDNAGNPVSDADVLFQIVSQPGTGVTFANGLTQITARTGTNGVATVVLSAGTTPGTVIVKVVSGDKTSQLTLQVQPAGPVPVPAAGGPPPSEGGGGGLTAWQAALIAAGIVILLSGGAVVVRRRRA